MASETKGPKVPTERPDPEAAARDPGPGAEDRPGFDLGGTRDKASASGVGSTTVPGGPKGSVAQGTTASGRADGLTNVSGSRAKAGVNADGGSDAGGRGGGGSGP